MIFPYGVFVLNRIYFVFDELLSVHTISFDGITV